ncbi:hypothetical protein QR680_006026 [Steinernema hermaphroditum]|uniref:ET module n=1 Tax=Steinernema hermaphroditum TaxID=289476 RepID=A0AA39LVU6_9BILA|nr:hypothetical protein QR680_006026 [Steinernema hermaphroditum]
MMHITSSILVFFAIVTKAAASHSFVSLSSPAPTEDPEIKCFVGVAIGSKNQYVRGVISDCYGECGNMSVSVHNSPATIFFCDPFQWCVDPDQHNTCKHALRGMSFCCCSTHDRCNMRENIREKQFPTSATPSSSQNRTCFFGASLDGPLSIPNSNTTVPPNHPMGVMVNCSGQCANVSLGRFGTVFLCDPLTICEGFKIVDKCDQIDNLLSGCCCSTDGCNLQSNKTVSTTTLTPTVSSKAVKQKVLPCGDRFVVPELRLLSFQNALGIVEKSLSYERLYSTRRPPSSYMKCVPSKRHISAATQLEAS